MTVAECDRRAVSSLDRLIADVDGITPGQAPRRGIAEFLSWA
jgi:hypothetical protein